MAKNARRDDGLCPKCTGSGRVIDTRMHGSTRRRRRECDWCSHRFTTVELVVDELITERVST